MTETRKPLSVRCGITRVSKVVLPAPLHPARPITFISFSGTRVPSRHCEERSDEAIHRSPSREMDCFAALAMTGVAAFRLLSRDGLYRLAAVVMLTSRYDENR